MNEYRKHFFRLNMALVGALLIIATLLLGVYTIKGEYDNMRQTMLETLEPLRNGDSLSIAPGTMPGGESLEGVPPLDALEPPQGPSVDTLPPLSESENDAEADDPRSRCITVFYSNGVGSILSGTGEMDAETISLAAESALSAQGNFGYLKPYDMFYLAAGRSESAKISLFPAAYLRSDALETALYLLGALLLLLLACGVISWYLSGLAMRPVEQAMEREKQFVADVSHDLKTPLAVMQASHHILLENPGQTVKEGMQWLNRSGEAMQNMRSLIDDMLTLSAVDSAQRLPRRETVDLSHVVSKAALQMEAMAFDRGIALETTITEGISIAGDGEALLRIASGLIENAIKYEPENGHISISLSAQGRKILLTVRNFGSVIAEEDLPHVFERFYRGDKARPSRQGHGLGLAIIKRTVELMNGRIEAKSTPQTGTIMIVTWG